MGGRETRSKTVAASNTAATKSAKNTLKKNMSKKKITKPATKNEEELNKENTPDLSVIQLPINLGTDNVRQILNIIKGGTAEIKDLVLNECTIIVECLECRNLFRSLANFVSHKGIYCKTHHCEKMLLFQSNSNCHSESQVVATVTQRDNDNEHTADLNSNYTQPPEVVQSDMADISKQSDVSQVTVNCKYLLPTAAGKRKESKMLSHNGLLPKKRKNLHAIVDELNSKANVSLADIQPIDSSTEVISSKRVGSVKVPKNDCDITASEDETAANIASSCEKLSLLLDETPGNAFYIENFSEIKKEFEKSLQSGKPKRNSHFICPICGPPSMWGNFKRHLVDNNHLSEEEANLWLYYKYMYKSPKETKVEESTDSSLVKEEVEANLDSISCLEIDADKDSGLGRCSPEMNEASSASGSCPKSSSLSTDATPSNLKQADTESDLKSSVSASCNQQQQFQFKRASSRIKRKKCLYNSHDCPNASCLKHYKSIPIEQSSATMPNSKTTDLSKMSLLRKGLSTSLTSSGKSLELDPKTAGKVDTKDHFHSESHSNESTSSDAHHGRFHSKKSKCEKESNCAVLSATTSTVPDFEISSNIPCPPSTPTTEKIVTKLSVKSMRKITIANLPAEPSSSNSTTNSSALESNNSSTEDHSKTDNNAGSTNAPLKIHLRNISFGSYAII